MKAQDEDGVQGQIDQGREDGTQEAFLDGPFRPDDIADRGGEDHGRHAGAEDAGIGYGIGVDFIICPNGIDEGSPEEKDSDAQDKAQKEAPPGGDGRIGPDGGIVLLPQAGGDQDAGPAADHGPEGHGNRENRRGQGDRSHLGRIAGHPDKEHICHIVEYHHEDDSYRRPSESSNGLPDRHFREQFLLSCHIFRHISASECFHYSQINSKKNN